MQILELLRARRKALIVILIGAVYGTVLVAMDGLTFPIRKDELHFWPTSLLFSHSLLPDIDTLRSYHELNTPLPFVLFGLIEYLFQGGIVLGRAFNFALSAIMTFAIGLADHGRSWRGAFSAIGLLLFPYYLGVGAHLYTDVVAAFFVWAGFYLYLNRRDFWAAVSFALAISSRQYMLAFPLAIAAYELGPLLRSRRLSDFRWAYYLAAGLSLAGWFLFFGGFGPQVEVERQAVATAALWEVLPRNALYFLTCIGVYFVAPEWLLFRRKINVPGPGRRFPYLAAALFLLALFFLFPPLRNEVSLATMGYFDRFVRLFAGDPLRMGIFYVFAVAAVVRFLGWNLPFVLVAANALLMMKAPLAWDKYALPLLVVLWFLQAKGALAEGIADESSGADPLLQ